MCGISDHLHKDLIENLKISSFNIFGYQVKPEVVAKNMGGKCLLWGNINPMLLLNGTKEEVRYAAKECLDTLAPFEASCSEMVSMYVQALPLKI